MMKQSRRYLSACLTVTGLMAILPNRAVAASFYAVDDGIAEASLGFDTAGDLAWLNTFDVLPGHEVITDIVVAWGSVANGAAVSVHLWRDPDNDGNPDDAVLLHSVNTTVAAPNTSTFITVDIPDTTLEVGSTFFVGAFATFAASPNAFFPILLDETASEGQSWVARGLPGTVDLNNLGGSSLSTVDSEGFPGNVLIRAAASPASTPTAVPEPVLATGLLGMGAVTLLKRRRIRSTSV